MEDEITRRALLQTVATALATAAAACVCGSEAQAVSYDSPSAGYTTCYRYEYDEQGNLALCGPYAVPAQPRTAEDAALAEGAGNITSYTYDSAMNLVGA